MGTRQLGLVLVASILAAAGAPRCPAESYLPDDVSSAIEAAGRALQGGEPRSKVLSDFRNATAGVRDTESFRRNGAALLKDMEDAVAREPASAPKAAPPELRLADSKWWPRVWRPESDERKRLGDMFRDTQDDPARVLLTGDRSVVGRLLPLLDDRTPTRAYMDSAKGAYPVIPRVCDLAISIIQFHGRVWFFDQFAFRELLHERGEETRTQIASQARAWWASAKDLSVADGIRRLLPSAGFYEKASMAENLIALGRVAADPSLQAEGRGALLQMFRESENQGHTGAYLANTLERHGDTSPVEEIYRRLAAAKGKLGYLIDSGLIFYLIKHAQRREWELLTDLAKEGYVTPRADGSWSPVGPAIVNSGAGKMSLWAVPAVALALERTGGTGSRIVAGSAAQSFSLADQAAEQLQAVTGADFGYRASGTSDERRAAIARAQRWWRDEGRARYTFDAIEKLLRERDKGDGR